MKKRYKFLREIEGKIQSVSGNQTWTIGNWEKVSDTPKLCVRGFHCSKGIYQAFSYVQGEILAEVEVRGESDIADDKECYQEMKIIKAYRWKKEDSVSLAIYASEGVISIFEKKHPEDLEPRNVIKAAKKWLKDPSTSHFWNIVSIMSKKRLITNVVSGREYFASRSAFWAGAVAMEAATAGNWHVGAARVSRWALQNAVAAARPKVALIKKIETWMRRRVKKLEGY